MLPCGFVAVLVVAVVDALSAAIAYQKVAGERSP